MSEYLVELNDDSPKSPTALMGHITGEKEETVQSWGQRAVSQKGTLDEVDGEDGEEGRVSNDKDAMLKRASKYQGITLRRFQAIEPLRGRYVGEWMVEDKRFASTVVDDLMTAQELLQTLYENRSASLQRFVGFLVMFHAMGRKVADFWSIISFGARKYDMSRTHSIMRIATTASPVSGSDVRDITLAIAQKARQQRVARIMLAFVGKLHQRVVQKSAEKRVVQMAWQLNMKKLTIERLTERLGDCDETPCSRPKPIYS